MASKIFFIGLSNAQIHHELPAYYLALNGYNVTYYTTGNNELKIEKLMGKLSYLSVYNENLKLSSSKLFRLYKQVRTIWKLRNKYDLLYLYSPHNLYTMFLGILFYKKKFIYHTQDFLNPNEYKLKSKIEQMIMKASFVNFINDINRGMFLKTFYQLKHFPIVIPTTLPKSFPFHQFELEYRKKWFKKSITKINFSDKIKLGLHIGSFSEKRCSKQLIKSLQFLSSEYCLIFTASPVESSSFKKIKKYALKYGVWDRILVYNFLNDNELMELTAQADVGFLLYPANDIGNFYQSPGRLSEYVGSGIRVVGSNFPSLELTILKYGFGKVCNPYCAQDIAFAFESVCIDEKLSRSSIQEKFKNDFSYNIFAEKILHNIELVLESINR